MLKNVLEDYLTSISEIQFFIPFKLLLESKGFQDIHQTHGNIEFGKDFIAQKEDGAIRSQYVFQLKVGDIDLAKYRTEIQPQLLDACTNSLSHPNYNKNLKLIVVFATTGKLNQYAAIALQEFNENVVSGKLKLDPIILWEKDILLNDFNLMGLENYFSVQKTITSFGEFFKLYSDIKNCVNLSPFEISSYTDKWLNLDWTNKDNRLYIFLQAVLFSKILADNKNHYESLLFISALIRVLIKNRIYESYKAEIEYYVKELSISFLNHSKKIFNEKPIFNLDKEGVFQTFYYNESCLKTAELLSLYILTSNGDMQVHADFLIDIIKNTQGIFRPLSENYTISIVLISLALIKLKELDLLKKYINNLAVWICDRYQGNGISAIGALSQEEYEQILSEYLTGLTFSKRNSCFMCTALLDICYMLGDSKLYENVANDFKAMEIVLEYFHVIDIESMVTHNSIKILTSTDYDYSLKFIDDYSQIIVYERTQNKIEYRDKSIFYIMFLLRDRYFPTFIKELL